MNEFGKYLRDRREERRKTDRRFSLRQVAGRVGIEPSYLSKVERGQEAPPSEKTLRRLALDLGEDVDMLLALGVATGVERRLSTAARGMGSGLCNVKTELLQL